MHTCTAGHVYTGMHTVALPDYYEVVPRYAYWYTHILDLWINLMYLLISRNDFYFRYQVKVQVPVPGHFYH